MLAEPVMFLHLQAVWPRPPCGGHKLLGFSRNLAIWAKWLREPQGSPPKKSRACSWKQKRPQQCRGGSRRAVCVQDLGVWLEHHCCPTQCMKAGSQSTASGFKFTPHQARPSLKGPNADRHVPPTCALGGLSAAALLWWER